MRKTLYQDEDYSIEVDVDARGKVGVILRYMDGILWWSDLTIFSFFMTVEGKVRKAYKEMRGHTKPDHRYLFWRAQIQMDKLVEEKR